MEAGERWSRDRDRRTFKLGYRPSELLRKKKMQKNVSGSESGMS